LTGHGIDGLTEQIVSILKEENTSGYDMNEDVLMSNIRHRDLMQKAIKSLERGIEAIKSGMTLDCVAADIHEAINSISEITGDIISEEIENEIFSKFCIGK
jgi:tRNA modification GTPase